jgi:hypothetical protein
MSIFNNLLSLNILTPKASVTDLNRELDHARSRSMEQSTRSGPGGAPSDPVSVLRGLFTSIPGGGDSEMHRDMEAIDRIRAGPAAGGKNPEDMSPQEIHSVLWQVLTFRDSGVYFYFLSDEPGHRTEAVCYVGSLSTSCEED